MMKSRVDRCIWLTRNGGLTDDTYRPQPLLVFGGVPALMREDTLLQLNEFGFEKGYCACPGIGGRACM